MEIITIWHIADKYLKMRRKYSPKNMVCTLHIYFIYLLVFRYLFPLLLLLVFLFALFCHLIFYISSLSPFLSILLFSIILELRLFDNQSTIDRLSLDICTGQSYLYLYSHSYFRVVQWFRICCYML